MIRVQIKSGSLLDVDIRRRLVNLFSTPKGTVPYMRGFGISTEAIDMPIDIAVNVLAADMAEACDEWEPSVRVRAVTPDYRNSIEGDLSLTVEVEERG